MKTKITFSFLISLIFIFFSCAEVQKQVAIDDLVGTYYGKANFVIQWSELNLGIDDQVVDNNGSEHVIIGKNAQDQLFIKFDDGMKVDLNNIQMATNGAVFNIPQQNISMNYEGMDMRGSMVGLNENTFGESRCDGFYDSENNELSFSFSGSLKLYEEGIEYEVPFAVGYYKFVKENK